MSTLVEWMKDTYLMARNMDLVWKPLYQNNMPLCGQRGIYTDINFRSDKGYQFIKFTIEYQPRCDAEGITHSEEGTKYYIFHSLVIDELDKKIEIPTPRDDIDPFDNGEDSLLVNMYGQFKYVFDDEETAKSVACFELLHLLYPYAYILSDEESKAWSEFLKAYADENE